MDRGEEQLLSLKFNRVVQSDSKRVAHFVRQEEFDQLTCPNQDDGSPDYQLPNKYAKTWRVLNKNFTDVYLGESISFYFCVTNDSIQEDVFDLNVRVDLQLGNNRVDNLRNFKQAKLEAKQNLDSFIDYEVTDLEKHLLIVTVNYKLKSGQIQVFRKTFQFCVKVPFDIKTQCFNVENNESHIEITLQNLSIVSISLDYVSLEPSEHFTVKDMNLIKENPLEDKSQRLVFGKVNRFNPNDCRQYLFCLNLKPEVEKDISLTKKVRTIGKLSLSWTSAIGTKGRLQTPQLERTVPEFGDLKLDVLKIPNQVDFQSEFPITLNITNCSDHSMEPIVEFQNKNDEQGIFLLGISGINLQTLKPMQSRSFDLVAYAIKTGLRSLPSISINDKVSNTSIVFDCFAYVFVNES